MIGICGCHGASEDIVDDDLGLGGDREPPDGSLHDDEISFLPLLLFAVDEFIGLDLGIFDVAGGGGGDGAAVGLEELDVFFEVGVVEFAFSERDTSAKGIDVVHVPNEDVLDLLTSANRLHFVFVKEKKIKFYFNSCFRKNICLRKHFFCKISK